MDETKALTVTTPTALSAFSGEGAFEAAQRMAKLLCESSLVPEQYRKNVPDCVIALEMAQRLGANPLSVMQNMYVVHGKPAWSSQFLIACVNASGKFSPLRYKIEGSGDDKRCIAWAIDKSGERLEGPEVSIRMAKDEGWFGKNGSKWKTMPDLMLRYRAATLFARTYAPELTMGIHTEDEVIDVAPIVTEPKVRKPLFKKSDKVEVSVAPASQREQFLNALDGLYAVTGGEWPDVVECLTSAYGVEMPIDSTPEQVTDEIAAVGIKKLNGIRTWLTQAVENRKAGKQ